MNKKIIWIVVITLCISILTTACGENSQTTNKTNNNETVQPENPTKVTETTQAPQSSKVKISDAIPDGWESVEGSVLPVQYMKETASFMIKKEMFTADTLDGVVDEAKAIFDKTFDNVKYQGDTEAIQIDGKEAQKIVFTCEVSKMNMKYMYVYVFVGNDLYAITLGNLAENFDSLSTDYETILTKIKFE